MIGVMDGNDAIVELLLPHVNARAITNDGRSAIRLAMDRGHPACADLLAPHSARKEADRALEIFGPAQMPRYAAQREAAAIAAAAEKGAAAARATNNAKGVVGAQTGIESPEVHLRKRAPRL
jgi:ankyrin repeat protein